MKVIIIYSGKGGVGKTTTTASIAKTLAEQGYRVMIIDADVNTPSMPVVFPKDKPSKNIKVVSLGYQTEKSIYVTGSAIREYISEAIDQANDLKPEYVLIDTPPSITDVHINLLEKIRPSGLIVVTQPNALSLTDVNRTALFFQEKGVNIIGVVENMCLPNSKSDGHVWKTIGRIPFHKDMDFNKVYDVNKYEYAGITKCILNIEAAILENKKRQLFDETITMEDVLTMPLGSRNDIRFVNLTTWEDIRELLQESESDLIGYDQFLTHNDVKTVGRVVKAFERDDTSLFMVVRAPSCEIRLIAGEIGSATLFMANSYYGVPRIKYQTSQGEIVLFPHEVSPVSNKELLKWLAEGFKPLKDGRYLPPKDHVNQCYHAFGNLCGLGDDWEQLYDDTLNGKLHRAKNSIQTLTDEISNEKDFTKRRRFRKQKTVGDLQYHIRNR